VVKLEKRLGHKGGMYHKQEEQDLLAVKFGEKNIYTHM
jgi:hypothetical protein